jgi:hypothetical protein
MTFREPTPNSTTGAPTSNICTSDIMVATHTKPYVMVACTDMAFLPRFMETDCSDSNVIRCGQTHHVPLPFLYLKKVESGLISSDIIGKVCNIYS